MSKKCYNALKNFEFFRERNFLKKGQKARNARQDNGIYRLHRAWNGYGFEKNLF